MKILSRYLFQFCLLLTPFFSITKLFAAEVDWIDLPETNYEEIFLYPSSQAKELTELVKKYHTIPKDQRKHLANRIKQLEKIKRFLANWNKEDLSDAQIPSNTHDLLTLLETMAKKRKNYLSDIKRILDSNQQRESYLKKLHLDSSDLADSKYVPLPMRNNVTYSVKMKEFWGNFWLETLDPCHRRLANYYVDWQRAKMNNKRLPTFFLWLEAQNLPKTVPIVRYLSSEELAKRQVLVKNGLFYYGIESVPLDHSAVKQRNLFVIDLKKNFYIEKGGDGIWHSSFSHGKPVLAAGQLEIKKGVLTTLAFDSGHYMPATSDFFQCVELLREMGATFAPNIFIVYYQDRNKYRIEVSSSCLTSSEVFLETIFDTQKRILLSTCDF